MQGRVLFPQWADVPEIVQASSKMAELIEAHGKIEGSEDPDDRSKARKIWNDLANVWWDLVYAIADARAQPMPDQLHFSDDERLFIDIGLPPEGLLPTHKDLDAAKVLSSRCSGGMFSYMSLSDWIAEQWSAILGKEPPCPAVGLPVAGRIEAMEKDIVALQEQRDGELRRIVDIWASSTPLDVPKLIAEMDENLMTYMKVTMRVPEYREGKEPVRQQMSQGRFRYVEAEEAIMLMLSSAQKAAEDPLPLTELDAFMQLHDRTKTFARKVLYSENDIKKTERRNKKIFDASAQKPDALKRRDLREAISKKREYLGVPSKTARCDGSPLCPQSGPPIDYATSAAKIEAMSELDMDMFAVPRVRMYGVPRVVFVPGQGLGAYDWQDHTLLIPMFPTGGEDKSLSYALGMFRWDSDEDRRLKNPYEQQIKENKKKSLLVLASSFYKDYSLWLTKEKQGYRILPRETRKVFVQMFAPRQEEA